MNQVFKILLKTNIIVTKRAGPKTSNKTRQLLINKSGFKYPKNLKKILKSIEIGQIKKYLKFPLSNKIFKVDDYVLSYIKRNILNELR